MRIRDWLSAVIVGLVIGGCAGMQTGASPETKAAVAPTGKLRVGFVLAAAYATKDPATGELKGVAVDLGTELARRVGVPVDLVAYPAPAALNGGVKSGELDVALTGMTAERAMLMDLSAPYMEVEVGYLVRAGAAIATALDVDKAGIRVGIVTRSLPDVLLSKTLKNATLVRSSSVAELFASLRAGKVDVISLLKPTLFAEVPKLPGSRILDERISAELLVMGVPKGRDALAAAYIGKFVGDAKAEGLVKSAADRAGLRGVVVPLHK